MSYRISNGTSGVNTARMVRVIYQGSLVACFTSRQDALDFIALKESNQLVSCRECMGTGGIERAETCKICKGKGWVNS